MGPRYPGQVFGWRLVHAARGLGQLERVVLGGPRSRGDGPDGDQGCGVAALLLLLGVGYAVYRLAA